MTVDKHHHAYAVLANEQSLEIGRRIKLGVLPQESERCLNCHSMNVLDPARRGQDFKLADGVSCDGCHGPAERWLGSHLNEPYVDSLKKGMKDIRNVAVRAETCLSCHLGDPSQGKTVDHEMLAAGHPPLEFELDSFSRKMPAHWRELPGDNRRATLWAVGQTVTLQLAARLLASAAGSDQWPDYSYFDCTGCHHNLPSETWRQRKLLNGPPGRPRWAGELVASSVRHLFPGEFPVESLNELDRHFGAVAFGRASDVTRSARRLADELTRLSMSFHERLLSKEDSRDLAIRLCDDAELTARCGPAAAQQLVSSLDLLVGVWPDADPRVVAELEKLRASLSDSVGALRYDPKEFVTGISAIRARL
jgi:hypothetical protein